MTEWKPANKPVIEAGQYRTTAEDFRVKEQLSFTPSGDGEHCLLYVEKRGANTTWVARQLADFFGLKERDVSYAGLKDRHAVTQQWFSLHMPGKSNPDSLPEHEDFKVIEQTCNNKKLRRGAIANNQFSLTLRHLRCNQDEVEQRLALIAKQGFPNYFGAQRFGHQGNNVNKAIDMLENGRRVKKSQRSIYLSALRSKLFNDYLNVRIEQDSWTRLSPQDRLMLNNSHSHFTMTSDDELADIEQRLQQGDLHIAGPLPGEDLDLALLSDLHLTESWEHYIELLAKARMKTDWRSLRVIPEQMSWSWLDEQSLQLDFALPSGAYATGLLSELGQLEDAMEICRVENTSTGQD
ncbi:tRNA pseudouridine(13) synthase TruD [Pleionea sp. CnH1-48]|uniref:tRNA pseudouridine(13) synthase TruD n=1 Tax=Pleionea sp. CnH1-48 TaxID=2954494 RepID=UPI002097395B|nr:tRNA pseudouridine(13) synthase TruD [Pleionea sp. CnH1-48]MCO7226375.1 tRNA pseudouridine(13) synthase TruD [Pleionea sp. CnH1-48]